MNVSQNDESRTVDKETFAQILEVFEKTGFEERFSDLDPEEHDAEDLHERDAGLFMEEYMEVDLAKNLTELDGFEKVFQVKTGRAPDLNEADNRDIATVYRVGKDLYFVDNDLYALDQYNYFCPEDHLTGKFVDWLEEGHVRGVEFAGSVEEGAEFKTNTEFAEKIEEELRDRWNQQLD